MGLHHYQVSVALYIELQDKLFADLFEFDYCWTIEELTRIIIAYEKTQTLNYYPALSYLLSKQAIPEQLLANLNSARRISRTMVSNLIQQKLSVAFSQVRVEQIEHFAYHIPSVKPNQQGAKQALQEHYHLNRMRVTMRLSQIYKHPIKDDGGRFITHLIYRWLSDSCTKIEVLMIAPSHVAEGTG